MISKKDVFDKIEKPIINFYNNHKIISNIIIFIVLFIFIISLIVIYIVAWVGTENYEYDLVHNYAHGDVTQDSYDAYFNIVIPIITFITNVISLVILIIPTVWFYHIIRTLYKWYKNYKTLNL